MFSLSQTFKSTSMTKVRQAIVLCNSKASIGFHYRPKA